MKPFKTNPARDRAIYMMDYDKILTELGEFGPWQIDISILLWLAAAMDGMVTMTASYSVWIF